MMRKLSASLLFILFISSFLASLLAGIGQELEKGKIIDKVVCQRDSTQSYALFLPSEYTPEKKWPILYALDPGARGKVPLEHFQAAAEKYNYIIAGSNNARNGPWEPVVRAIQAVWHDTSTRFSADLKRVYVTGFSGGSRAASLFPQIINRPVTGIIGCGAGLAVGIEPKKIAPAFYHGVVGIEDFNYLEMVMLDRKFDEPKVSHRILVFEGGHAWPPEDVCRRVIEWMEIMGMKQQIRPADEELIKDIYERELAKAQALQASGQLLQAVSDYEALASTFKDWLTTEDIETRIEHIKQSKEYQRSMEDEDKRNEKEIFHNRNFRRILDRIEKNPPPRRDLNSIFTELDLYDLLDKAGKKKNINESSLALRVLFSIEMNSSRKGGTYLQKGEQERAILFFEIAFKASLPDSSRLKYRFYNLACAYARSNSKKKAVKNLKLAVENGFNDLAHIEQDEDLESIRHTEEFQKIIESLKEK
jgi:tetratricopeptide (TPR) repeat protein